MNFDQFITRYHRHLFTAFVVAILSISAAQVLGAEATVVTVEGPATLVWEAPTENTDGTPLTDLAGFRIYFGLTPRAASCLGPQDCAYGTQIEVTNPTDTTSTFTVPVPNGVAQFFFAMTAYDDQLNESDYSNEISRTFNIVITDTRPPQPPALQSVDLQFTCVTGLEPGVTCTVTVAP
jgi:hypothetical protein